MVISSCVLQALSPLIGEFVKSFDADRQAVSQLIEEQSGMSILLSRRQRGISALIVLSVVGLMSFGYVWFQPTSQPSADVGRSIAEAFLAQIRAGNPEKAWDSTTAEFKSAQGRESFINATKKLAFLRSDLPFVSMQTVTVQDKPRSEYLFRAPDGSAKTNVRLVIGNEQGDWKVDICVLPTP